MIVIIICIASILFVGCDTANITGEVSSEETLKVGAILGFSGPGAFYTESIVKGMNIAIYDLRKKGIDIEIIYEDGKTNAVDSVSSFNKLKDIDDVDMVISLFAVSTVPLVPLAEDAKIPILTSINSAKNIAGSSYVLQYYLAAENYAYPIAKKVSDDGHDKVLIIYVNDEYGKSVKDAFVSKYDGDVVIESFIVSDMDYKTILSKVDSDVDAIVFGGFKPHYVNILKNMKELNIELPFYEMSPNTMYPSVVSQSESEGVIGVSLEFAINGDSDFETKYFAEYNEKPDVAASLGYDMIQIIGQSTKGKSSDHIVEDIVSMRTFTGLNGITKITNDGRFIFPTEIVQVKSSRLVVN